MKPFVILLLFMFGNACDKSEELASVENSENETLPQQQMVGPDEVLFKIKIIETPSTDKEICGKQKENVFGVEVVEVMISGSSLNQKLPKQHKMDVDFLFKPDQLSNGTILEAKARETLCQDASVTYFTVIEHKILE